MWNIPRENWSAASVRSSGADAAARPWCARPAVRSAVMAASGERGEYRGGRAVADEGEGEGEGDERGCCCFVAS